MRMVAAALALVVVAGGCAAGDGGGPSSGPPQDSASASPSESASESEPGSPPESAPEEPLPCVPGVEPFTGPAAEEHGPDRVMAAYCLLVELAGQQEGTSLALPVPEQEARDLVALRALLTARAGAGWDRLVRARAAGERRATERVNGLTLHDVRAVPRGYTRADDGPYVFGTQVGPATAELARGGAALRLTFTLETGLVLEERGDETGRHSLLPVARRASYVLVPDVKGWLIDDWETEFEHGQVQLVSG